MEKFKVRRTYLLFILILSVLFIAGCGGGGGTTETGHWLPSNPEDTTAPTVIATINANGATNVPINTKVGATFSKEMDPASITAATFTVKQGATVVAGTMTYSGVKVVFTPASNLAVNTTYTATITTGARDLAQNALAADYVWSWTTGAAADTTAPTVTLTDPVTVIAPGVPTSGVALNKKIAATFSEAMDATTITTTTFTLKQGATAVSGSVGYLGLVATFTPASNLAASTTYTATITTGATDQAGNALAANYTWSFTTGAAADTTAPTVTLTDPANLETGVALNKKIAATFSEGMDPLTITTLTFTLKQGATAVSGSVGYLGLIATFTPASSLAAGTTYTATITTGARDLAGNALTANYTWSFTTGAAADTTAPTVVSTDPLNLAIGVALNKKVQATFSEAMDPLTILNTTFTLTGPGVTPVSGSVGYLGLVATFTPTNPLASNTTYTATITTGAKDLAGNALAVNYTWTFTTLTTPPLGPAIVNLGTAGNFVLLTKTGITTTGVTNITGNIGVSPIAAAAITGFGLIMDVSNQFATSPVVTGRVYAADYAVPTPANMTTAISDMETAYVDAAGRATPDATELFAGNLSGQTITPGLYKWSTGVSINAASTVTLSGGANDVWIFQIAGDITVNPGAGVTLLGGAQAKNVFWQVGGGTGVTLDTTSAFKGVILATKAIVFKNGATLVNGRALAQTNVTLIGNTITEPAP